MHREEFDIAIIGAGPGGYVAAIRCAQLGKKVALIEKKALGGTCLNVGCIPTKTLLAGAEVLHTIKHADAFGIAVGSISFNYAKMKARKDEVVSGIRKGLTGLLQANQIKVFQGSAEFTSPNELKIKGEESLYLKAHKVIIATGSAPSSLKMLPCDHKNIYDSTSILDMTEIPKSLAIIGGGYIGCEFASLYAELGVKVTILEALSSIVSLQGKTISSTLTRSFIKQGIDIRCNAVVEKISPVSLGLELSLKEGDPLICDKVLISVGRKVVSEGLALEMAGVLTDNKGAITVNEKMETTVPGIYAIGDVTALNMLAHVASHQGIVAANQACGIDESMHYDAVPAVIFTHPEIASVGLTEEAALEKGLQFDIGRYPFQALGKSVAAKKTEGFVELLSEKKTGRILGAQIVGDGASVLIAEVTLAIHGEIPIDILIDTIHAHPTISEAISEAALLAQGTPLHFPPKSKKKE